VDSATAEDPVQRAGIQADPDTAGVLRQGLIEHLAALPEPQGSLATREDAPAGAAGVRRRLLILYPDAFVVVRIDELRPPSITHETRPLKQAVAWVRTRAEGSAQTGGVVGRLNEWRFLLPNSEAIKITGRVTVQGPDEAESFARAAAANTGPRLPLG
jgi:hypothetical protein